MDSNKSNSEFTQTELYSYYLEYNKIFTEFKRHYVDFFPIFVIIQDSYRGDIEDQKFLTSTPHLCDVDVMYQKLKVISDALKDFHTFLPD